VASLPDEIHDRVDRQERRTSSLRERQRADQKLFMLERTAEDAPAEYGFYTSNSPKVVAKKIIAWITQAELIVSVSHPSDREHQRTIDDGKETFLNGVLNAGDMRLRKRGRLRSQLAWFVTIRGGAVGRALLRADSDENTFVDIMPWDILHTYWELGGDGELEWACYKTKKTKTDIMAEYGLRRLNMPNDEGSDVGVDVYDYYDRNINAVVMDGRVLKKKTRHGSERVPVFFAPVETAPMLQAGSAGDMMDAYMESIYEENRGIIPKNNQLMSAVFDLVLKTRDRSWVLTSRDGSKVLEADPNRSAAEIALAEGESLTPVAVAEMSQRLGDILGVISGELQRGSLSHAVFGELQFQLSGFAINSLKQGTDTALRPRLDAVQNAYEQILDIIGDMYSSDRFAEFEIPNKSLRSEARIIPTWVVREGCRAEVQLIPQLPEDDMTKITVAQMLREGPVPLADDTYIRERIMRFPESGVVDDAVKAQMGERMLPESTLYTMGMALAERGEPMLAQMYFDQLMMLYQQRIMQMQQMGMVGGGLFQGNQINGGGVSPGGPAPGVFSNAAQGAPPSPRQSNNANAGAPTLPGQARPGADTSMQQRLAGMGLVGPRG
jgi:hypothetical protein